MDSAAYDIDNHVSMLKNILGEKLVIKSDLDMQSWNPSHCANTKCARELFSIYGKSFFFLDLCEYFSSSFNIYVYPFVNFGFFFLLSFTILLYFQVQSNRRIPCTNVFVQIVY